MKQVAIVDYGVSNIDSVARAVEECGGQPLVTSDPRELSAQEIQWKKDNTHLYQKLAVHSRGEAVYEATQMGLLRQ